MGDMSEHAVVGLIGAGGIARSQHLPNLARAPHARLKTVCDLDQANLNHAADRYGVTSLTTDYREVLADEEIQAVFVATREDRQAPLTMEALEAGKHVYVEKPLAETAEVCRQVVETQQRTGRSVAVGFNRRFAPAYLKIKEVVQRHGGAKNIHYRIMDEYWRWGQGRNYPPGVRVLHELCHVFDVLRWLTDSDAETIYCVASRPDDEILVLRMGSGCVASITSSGYMTKDMPKEQLEIVLDRGGVTCEDFVEVRTFGLPDCEAVYTFAGHTHPQHEFTHKYLLRSLGSDGLRGLRRMAWELERRQERDADAAAPDRAEMEHYLHERAPLWNYMMDKGWLAATDHFAECIARRQNPRNATPSDAWQASLLGHAAIESREKQEVVRL